MERRGLNVTQTGNKLCVPSCSVVHTKGLLQTFALVQAVLYRAHYVLPGTYITGSVERY